MEVTSPFLMSYSLMVFVFLIEVIEVEDKHSGRLSMHECADLKKNLG